MGRRGKFIPLIWFVATIWTSPAAAQQISLTEAAAPADHTRIFHAVKIATALPLDASLDSPVWKTGVTASAFENFYLRAPAKYATTAYFLYDDKYFYAAVHAEQNGTPITAVQTVDHAGIAADDHITLEIDTSGNGSRVYTFRASPRGIHDEASSENARYAPDWYSAAKLLPDGGYNIVMQIPLSVMRAQSAPVQQWRVNIARAVVATGDLYTWAYEAGQTDPTLPQFWPAFDGIRISAAATRPAPHADVYALVSGGTARRRFQSGFGRFVSTDPRTTGVDFTYPLSNTLAFVGTLNPDFSNVEKDQTSAAPQIYQRNYSEYRPFFAQGAQYINALPNVTMNGITESLFYTPSIGIFDRGTKLEGTAGLHSIGALNVRGDGFNDTAFGYAYTKPDRSVRLSAQGVFANHADARDAAYGLGINTRNVRSGLFQIVKAQEEQNSVTGASHSFFASSGFQNATWFAALDYRDVGPNFNPADGYTAIDDIRGPRLALNYNGVGSKRNFIKSWSAFGMLDRFVDHTGAPKEYDANVNASVIFKNQVSIAASAGPSGLRFDPSPDAPLTAFNLRNVTFGYKDGSPAPIDLSYSWGPFDGKDLRQLDLSAGRTIGAYSLSMEYGGTTQSADGLHDSQWIRRLSLGRSFGRNATLAVALRGINGRGGYALPGTNVALSYHQRFANLDELYIDYGTPAARQTLHRAIVKYVFHVGGASGT